MSSLWGTPSSAHVSRSSGKVEWYTPPGIIRNARNVMGGIDLDPASTKTANKIVRAGRFLTEQDDALDENTSWRTEGGRVWLNPPYRQPDINVFASRLLREIDYGTVKQCVWLSNNATETKWGNLLLSHASVMCFPARRIAFLNQDLEPENRPLQGQMLLGFGPDLDYQVFAREFSYLGTCAPGFAAFRTPSHHHAEWRQDRNKVVSSGLVHYPIVRVVRVKKFNTDIALVVVPSDQDKTHWKWFMVERQPSDDISDPYDGSWWDTRVSEIGKSLIEFASCEVAQADAVKELQYLIYDRYGLEWDIDQGVTDADA